MKEWIMNCAKAIGLRHIKGKIPCQDSVLVMAQNNVNVITLSDGCSSAHFSHYGSQLVVENISQYLCINFDELYALDDIIIKKRITDFILRKNDEFVKNNIKEINNYFDTSLGKHQYNEISNYEIMNFLSSDDGKKFLYETLLDATVLFVAVKNNKCLIGHCGDGFILGFKNDEFEIISEEPKSGARNFTNYPTSIFYQSKALKNDDIWGLFRIFKYDFNNYSGFTLMSDGAETQLVFPKNGIYIPVKNNNCLLYEIISSETPERAKKYLTELLEKTYRERTNKDGDLEEITDDDVSIALMICKGKKEITNNNLSDNTNEELKPKKEKLFYYEKLHLLCTPNGNYEDEKEKFLDEIFRYYVENFKGKENNLTEFESKLRNTKYCDDEDIKMIFEYGKNCNVF